MQSLCVCFGQGHICSGLPYVGFWDLMSTPSSVSGAVSDLIPHPYCIHIIKDRTAISLEAQDMWGGLSNAGGSHCHEDAWCSCALSFVASFPLYCPAQMPLGDTDAAG